MKLCFQTGICDTVNILNASHHSFLQLFSLFAFRKRMMLLTSWKNTCFEYFNTFALLFHSVPNLHMFRFFADALLPFSPWIIVLVKWRDCSKTECELSWHKLRRHTHMNEEDVGIRFFTKLILSTEYYEEMCLLLRDLLAIFDNHYRNNVRITSDTLMIVFDIVQNH